jgi:hypothetical protein
MLDTPNAQAVSVGAGPPARPSEASAHGRIPVAWRHPALDAIPLSRENQSGEVLYASLSIRGARGCGAFHSTRVVVYTGNGFFALLWSPRPAPFPLVPARLAGRLRRFSHESGIRLSVYLGPLRDLGMVYSGVITWHPVARQLEAVLDYGIRLGKLGFVLPGQQLCRLGRVQHVSEDFGWIDDFVHHGATILSAKSGRRFDLYRGHVCDASRLETILRAS